MHLIALLLLTLVGYSIGAVLGAAASRTKGQTRIASPQLGDLGWIILLSTAALYSRAYLGKWRAVGVWMLIALAFAAAWTWVRRRTLLTVDRDQERAANQPIFQRLWAGWKRFARQMGNFQGRVLLAFFYFGIVTPFGLAVRLFSDPLHLQYDPGRSFWLDRPPAAANIETARRQS